MLLSPRQNRLDSLFMQVRVFKVDMRLRRAQEGYCSVFYINKKSPQIRQEKRSPSPNFWVRISSGGVGVFNVKGWRAKSLVCPSKPRENKLFGGAKSLVCPRNPGKTNVLAGYPRSFGWDIPGVPRESLKTLAVFPKRQ